MKTALKLEDLQIGDVVLYPPEEGDWLAQAIALLTNGTVNHAAIYYGVKDGKHCVAESVLKGMGINPLPDCITEKYAHPILRHVSGEDMSLVVECAKKYVDEGNAYPYVNLGMLALLLIAKKFTKDTMRSKAFYDFALLVCVKLMRVIQESDNQSKHKMSCSQFTAQCFTDAGEKYDLKFDRLIVQLDRVLKNAKDDNTLSLLDMLSETSSLALCSDMPEKVQEDSVLAGEEKITHDFIRYIESEKNGLVLSAKEVFETKPLTPVIIKIVFCLYEMITGSKTDDIQVAIEGIKYSTNRNFLVTPEDININCTNLKRVGVLTY